MACRSGGSVVCSLSTVLSSATESCSDFSSARAIIGAASRLLIQLTKITTGCEILSSGCRM